MTSSMAAALETAAAERHLLLTELETNILLLRRQNVELNRQVMVLGRALWMMAEPGSSTEEAAREALKQAGLIGETGRPLTLGDRYGDQALRGDGVDEKGTLQAATTEGA